MKQKMDKAVRDANIRVFDGKDFDEYEKNPSIFEYERQNEITGVISKTSEYRDKILDIGCGTGNILRLAKNYFRRCYGVDISKKLLSELKHRYSGFNLLCGEGMSLPYKDAQFDLVTLYGVMHHIVNHEDLLHEVHRILKKGGCIYIDHDPNYFFGRFYHVYYKLRYMNRPGFGTDDAEMSEYHHTHTGGLNPLMIKKQLAQAGFKDVSLNFRMTTNPQLPLGYKFIRGTLRFLSKFYPAKSFYSHFWIVAKK